MAYFHRAAKIIPAVIEHVSSSIKSINPIFLVIWGSSSTYKPQSHAFAFSKTLKRSCKHRVRESTNHLGGCLPYHQERGFLVPNMRGMKHILSGEHESFLIIKKMETMR